ncbi:MAG: DUF493 family protein [Cytophagales bacterium]|nr:DUF493 family protein [Cytophagales bacterium]
MSADSQSFREKLEAQHDFPGPYTFKFIIPEDKKGEVEARLPKGELSYKASSGKKYTSITLKATMKSSDEVIAVYTEVAKIEGVLSL